MNNAALILMKKVTPFHERFVIFYVNCLLKSRGKEAGRKEVGLPFPRRIFSSEEWGKLGNFPKKFWGMGKIWGKFGENSKNEFTHFFQFRTFIFLIFLAS